MNLGSSSVRRLRRRGWSSASTVVVLAAGIGLAGAGLSPIWRTTVIGLPLEDADRIVAIWEVSDARGWYDTPVSPANFRDLATRTRSLEKLAYYASGRARGREAREQVVAAANRTALLSILSVSLELFDVLGVRPAFGAGFRADDFDPSSRRAVVISDRMWRQQLGHDPAVVGRTIKIEGVDHSVVGVMPPSFWFAAEDVDAWVPLALPAQDFLNQRQARILRVVGRLAPGVSLAQARTDVTRAARELSQEYPRANGDTGVALATLAEWIVGPRRPAHTLAAIAGMLLLLISLVNAGLLIWATLAAREPEFAVVRALGASPGRLLAEVSSDLGLIVLVATLIGWPFALMLLHLVGRILGVVHIGSTAFDTRALLVAGGAAGAGVTLMASLALHRILRVSVADVHASRAGRVHVGQGRGRWANAVQIAVAFAVSLVSVVSLHAYTRVSSEPSGINDRDALAATVTLRGPRFRDKQQVARYFRDVLRRIRLLPGVSAAGATAALPFRGGAWTSSIWMPDLAGIENAEVRQREITDGYVRAAGLPLIEGREFSADDSPDAPVLLVNQHFVQRFMAGRSPLGHRVGFAPSDRVHFWWRIVGVVGNERLDARSHAPAPLIYRLHAATPEETMTIIVRTVKPRALQAPVLESIKAADTDASLLQMDALDRAMAGAFARELSVAELAALASAMALAQACLGLYAAGIVHIRRRQPELAVRIALGAGPRRLAGLVWRPVAALLGVGLLAGSVLAWLVLDALRNAVPFVESSPVDYVITAAALTCATGLAVWPAFRLARRTDPVSLFRQPD